MTKTFGTDSLGIDLSLQQYPACRHLADTTCRHLALLMILQAIETTVDNEHCQCGTLVYVTRSGVEAAIV